VLITTLQQPVRFLECLCGIFWMTPAEIKVNFLDKLRLEAKFDDFTVIAG
jgi:hypothetical protein